MKISKLFDWKYKYFRKKLHGVECMLADIEFKRFKSLEIREDVRLAYDNTQAKIQQLNEQIKTFPEIKATEEVAREKEKKEKWTDEQGRVEDQRILLERDRDRYLAQMKQIDLDVHGSPKTNEYPDGVSGIDDQIDSLQELKGMVKSYIKSL